MLKFQGDKVFIDKVPFSINDVAESNVVDSFVAMPNKIGTGSGEARLYVFPQNKLQEEAFFKFDSNFLIQKGQKSYFGSSSKCFLNKDNLLKYMENALFDYKFPQEHYREDISLLYENRLNSIQKLNEEVYFNVYNQVGGQDSSRFYIGSVDKAWDILREISLPKITSVKIYKLENDLNHGEILYYFELILNSKSSSRIKSGKLLEKRVRTDILNDTTIDETEKKTIIKARIGQGKFRRNVLSIMPFCPFTGINVPYLLRASHIIPWAECKNNEQRIDGYNGLTLTPTYDLLFDLFLISFEDNGRLIVSNFLSEDLRKKLNLEEGKIYPINNEAGKRNYYLNYHRDNIRKK